MQHRLLTGLLGTAILATLGSTAAAQSARSGGATPPSAAQQVIAQMQQVGRERDQAQADAAKAKQDLTAAQDELKKLKAELEAVKAKAADPADLARAQREAQAANADLERVRGNVNELNRQLHDTAVQLRDSENGRNSLKGTLSTEVRTHEACVRDNAELSSLALDALKHYEQRNGSGEPFFRISQTRVQNLVDEYRAKIDDLKAPKPVADASAP